jgi:PKD repeat protein
MRKLYALLAGFVLTLLAASTHARPTTPDVANFTFTIDHAAKHVVFTNTSTLGNEPGLRRAYWSFGDGTTVMTGPLQGTSHVYQHPGAYTVCLKIYRFRPNHLDSVLTAHVCKTITINTVCRADFERLPLSTVNNPLRVAFKAIPWHNDNKRPVRICWSFGDGNDTCIQYSNTNPGPFIVHHTYASPGLYEVCVKIYYQGGCEARKCKPIRVERPDSCRADFVRLPATNNDPLVAAFKALPWHNNNKKPLRICWTFGDGEDTCINYPNSYTGVYGVRHRYQHPGLYEVCVKIYYQGGCEARKCERVQVGPPDRCEADFVRLPLTANNPLEVGFKALPHHNNNRKPARICWRFGDGEDTCINYPRDFNGPYTVSHRYRHAGNYEVCVKIEYYGGCEARKCKEIVVPPPVVNCSVRLFEITPSITSLVRGFLAVPNSTPNSRPVRICWYFGDGEDTCIMIDPHQPLPNFVIRHTYPGPGIYRACVKVRFANGCVAEDCKEVVIRPVSSICGGFMIDSLIAPRTFKFRGSSIHARNDEVIGYRWTFGDGSSAVGREVTHTYNSAGTFEVCLYIRTRLGCETRICQPVRVPGHNQPALNLSPNPVINNLHAAFFSTHTEQVTIRIVNNGGATVRNYVRNANVGPNNWDFDVSSLLPGLYSFVVQSPNQQASAIFIKQ